MHRIVSKHNFDATIDLWYGRASETTRHVLNEWNTIHASYRHYECRWLVYLTDFHRQDRKKPVGPSQTLAKCHQFRDKTSSKRQLKLKTKIRPTWWVTCIKDEVTRLVNQEASLVVLKNGVQIIICAPFLPVKMVCDLFSKIMVHDDEPSKTPL